MSAPLEIEPDASDRLRRDGPAYAAIDVREPWEVAICGFEETRSLPLQRLAAHVDELPRDRPLVIVCHTGHRSLQAAEWLHARGIEGARSLSGGVARWALEIDPTMAGY